MPKKYCVLYNPFSGNGRGEERSRALSKRLQAEIRYADMTAIDSYEAFFRTLGADEKLVLCGGDGTLNRFVNETRGLPLPAGTLYYPAGSGNDFARDLNLPEDSMPVPIAQYLERLPQVTVNGRTSYFLNGVGYGIDGYCCEVGDRLRSQNKQKINYALIAIKGMLFHFKPVNAVITVDGARHAFDHVWLAPAMNGRFYGGGMMPTPEQRRLEKGTVSVMTMHSRSRLRVLAIFPSIFKGKHVEHESVVQVYTGSHVTVEFDRPTALQIDGETVLGVSKYEVHAA